MNFFKNCLKIYKSDFKKISKSFIAVIICIGLALLPSLYAWVNILACIDPYGNTKDIKVGIVNEDAGASALGLNIDIGGELVDELRENDKLCWTFFDDADYGIEQCRNGSVYATIIIPENFSEKLLTALDENPQKPQLKYYVNEKINAIAPKMTDSGASTLQKTISAEFSKTVVSKVFEVLNPIGLELDENMDKAESFKSFLLLVDDNMPEVEKHLDNLLDAAKDGKVKISDAANDAEILKKVLSDSLTLSEQTAEDIKDLNSKLPKDAKDLRNNLTDISTAMDEIAAITSDMDTEITNSKPDIVSRLDDISVDVNLIYTKLDAIESESGIIDQNALQRIKTNITNMSKALRTISESIEDIRDVGDSLQSSSAVTLFAKIQTATENLISENAALKENINNSFKKLNTAIDAADNVIAQFDANAGKDAIISAIETAKTALDSANPTLFKNIINTLTAIENKIQNGQNVEMLILRLSTQIDTVRDKVNTKKDSINTRIDGITDSLNAVNSIAKTGNLLFGTVSSGLDSQLNALRKTVESLSIILRDSNLIISGIEDSEIADFSDLIGSVSSHLKTLEKDLESLESKINTSDDTSNLLKNLSKTCYSVKNICQSASDTLTEHNISKIQKTLTTTSSLAKNISSLLASGISGTDDIKEFVEKLNNDYITVDDINDFKEKYPEYLGKMSEIADKIRKLSEYISLNDLANILQSDGDNEGDFFSEPVELDTTKLFPIKNYGAGLTPFYTTLCLWVGALLLTALLSTKAHNATFAYTPNEEFVGKYMLFASIAAIQGFVAAMGDIVLLKIEMAHPVLFILLSMLYSLVFSMIIYCLTSLLSNVGKAIGVVFLVFQLAGTGGTFPIECTPKFFQIIYKILPFTYAINGMREAVGGIVWKNLLIDIAVVVLYGIIFTVIGLLLKKNINHKIEKFSKQLTETKVIGH